MAKSFYFPGYTCGVDAYKEIPKICEPYGKKAVVVGGKRALASVKDILVDVVKGSNIEIVDFIWFGGDANYSNLAALEANETVKGADMVFAVGGGRAMDTCKILCAKLHKPMFSIPTIASTCAAITSVAVFYDDKTKVFKGVEDYGIPAKHCFINPEVIAKAPYEYMWAGIGDALSKQYETSFAAEEKDLSHYNALGVQLVGICSEKLMEYGVEALQSVKEQRVSPALERVILEILVTTGYCSLLIDLDYNSAVAHGLYYGFTALSQGEKHLHGEEVAYGTLVMLLLQGKKEEFQKVYDFCRAAKLSVCLADFEISEPKDIELIVKRAAGSNDVKCLPYVVTEEMIYKAINDLEEYHKAYSV